MNDTVQTHIDEQGNATVLLNRPQVHNAFNPEMVDALAAALKTLRGNAAVRAVVLMGEGPSFCAGADIGHMKSSAGYTARRNHKLAARFARMYHRLYTLDKPTVACVRGAVRGGGCGLVAACDIAVATRRASFRLSEVKLGIIPAMASPYLLAAVGERMARRYMLTGEEFDAAEARRIGLVHEVVEEEELVLRVSAILAQLRSSGPRAMTAVKALIPLAARAKIGGRIVAETARRIAAIRATPEAQEGLAAFLEKRPPDWESGRRRTPARKAARARRTCER